MARTPRFSAGFEAKSTRLGREIASLCYPRGKLNEAVMRVAAESGYRWAVVTPKRAGLPKGPLALRRVGIYRDDGPLAFRVKTSRLARRALEPVLWLRGRRL